MAEKYQQMADTYHLLNLLHLLGISSVDRLYRLKKFVSTLKALKIFTLGFGGFLHQEFSFAVWTRLIQRLIPGGKLTIRII